LQEDSSNYEIECHKVIEYACYSLHDILAVSVVILTLIAVFRIYARRLCATEKFKIGKQGFQRRFPQEAEWTDSGYASQA